MSEMLVPSGISSCAFACVEQLDVQTENMFSSVPTAIFSLCLDSLRLVHTEVESVY